MDIFLVRHTEYENPTNIFPYHLPVPLSAVGRRKATDMGKWFVDHGFSNIPIISSPIVRTRETAELIANKAQSEITIDEDLTELWSKLQGTPLPTDGTWNECYKPGVQEEVDSILARMLRAYDKVIQKNENYILVSHGDPLLLLYYHLQGKTPPQILDSIPDYIEKGDFIQITINADHQMIFNRYRIE